MPSCVLQAMTSLTDPEISFVEVARGLGVPGGRAETCEAFFTLMEESRKVEGPFLIEAII